MRLELTVDEKRVLAVALATYIPLGTGSPEVDEPLAAAGLLHIMAPRCRQGNSDNMKLPLDGSIYDTVISAMSYAVTFYTAFKEDDRPAVLSLVLKLDNQDLTEEIHDFYAGES
jgi:hypothetical protein